MLPVLFWLFCSTWWICPKIHVTIKTSISGQVTTNKLSSISGQVTTKKLSSISGQVTTKKYIIQLWSSDNKKSIIHLWSIDNQKKVSSFETKERPNSTNVEQFLRSDPVLKPVFTMRNGGYQNEWEPGEKGVCMGMGTTDPSVKTPGFWILVSKT